MGWVLGMYFFPPPPPPPCRERTIAQIRTSDSSIVQSRSWLPDAVGGVLWFGPGAAHGTAYVPLLAGMLSAPDNLQYGWQGVYNLSTSFWAHRQVLNLAQAKFSFMVEDIRGVQQALESRSQQLVDDISRMHLSPSADISPAELQRITDLLAANSRAARDAFGLLFHALVYTYADGWINSWASGSFTAHSAGIY